MDHERIFQRLEPERNVVGVYEEGNKEQSSYQGVPQHFVSMVGIDNFGCYIEAELLNTAISFMIFVNLLQWFCNCTLEFGLSIEGYDYGNLILQVMPILDCTRTNLQISVESFLKGVQTLYVA